MKKYKRKTFDFCLQNFEMIFSVGRYNGFRNKCLLFAYNAEFLTAAKIIPGPFVFAVQFNTVFGFGWVVVIIGLAWEPFGETEHFTNIHPIEFAVIAQTSARCPEMLFFNAYSQHHMNNKWFETKQTKQNMQNEWKVFKFLNLFFVSHSPASTMVFTKSSCSDCDRMLGNFLPTEWQCTPAMNQFSWKCPSHYIWECEYFVNEWMNVNFQWHVPEITGLP